MKNTTETIQPNNTQPEFATGMPVRVVRDAEVGPEDGWTVWTPLTKDGQEMVSLVKQYPNGAIKQRFVPVGQLREWNAAPPTETEITMDEPSRSLETLPPPENSAATKLGGRAINLISAENSAEDNVVVDPVMARQMLRVYAGRLRSSRVDVESMQTNILDNLSIVMGDPGLTKEKQAALVDAYRAASAFDGTDAAPLREKIEAAVGARPTDN